LDVHSQSLKVNETEVRISFSIASAQIRRALNSSTVLQPNSIKWDIRVTNFVYNNPNTTLGFENVIRSKERVVRVNRNVVNRTDVEIPHNRTLPANGTQISIGNGKGRIGFVNRTDVEDGKGNKSNGTVLVSAPLNGTANSTIPDLDDAEKGESRERKGDDDDDNKSETEAYRVSSGNRTRLVFTFKSLDGSQARNLFWDPETNVADQSEASSLSATDVETVISQPAVADAIFDPPLDAGATTPDASPQATPSTKPKGSDASRIAGSQLSLGIAGAAALAALL
jgi:hypothetical protein